MTQKITLPQHELLAGADLLAEAAESLHEYGAPSFEPYCRMALAWYQRHAPDDPALVRLLEWFAQVLHEGQRTAAAQEAEQRAQRITLLWRARQDASERILRSLCTSRPGKPLPAERHQQLIQALGKAVRECTQAVRRERQPAAPQVTVLTKRLVDEVLAEPMVQIPQELSPVTYATSITRVLRETRQLVLDLVVLPQPLPTEDDALVGEAVLSVMMRALHAEDDPLADGSVTNEEEA